VGAALPGRGFAEDPFATVITKLVELTVKKLVRRADTGISDGGHDVLLRDGGARLRA
jgi:hypothetical protein